MNLLLKYRKYFLLTALTILVLQLSAYNTVVYNAKNGIASNSVQKIFVDNTHRIWLGTENGVSCITGNGISNYIYSNGLNFSRIWEITQCPDQSLWFGSFGNGLYEFRNNRFIHYQLPRSRANNSIRKLKPFGKYLYIGTESGLNVFDYKNHQFVSYKNLSTPDSLQILDFFEYRNRLYFQSFMYGTFEVNPENRTYKKIRFNLFENKWNYSAYMHGNTFYLARTHFNKDEKHNLLFWNFNKYLEGAKPDSIAISTIAWEFAHVNNDIFAACWGVRDDSGGLYKLQDKSTTRMNELMGISTNQLWDIAYDKELNKLYVASLDKGLFVCDFNSIVTCSPIMQHTNILDLEVIGKSLFVLSKDTLSLYQDGKFVKSISKSIIEKYIQSHQPNQDLNSVQLNAPKRFRDLTISDNQIVINSNFAEIRFDISLNIIDFISAKSDGRLCFMKNNDVLIFRDYGNSELCENFGKGKRKIFNYWETGKTNPRDVNGFCKLNDTTYLLSSDNQRMYIYRQNDTLYKRFEKLGAVNLPAKNDRYAENSFVSVDKSNILYLGKYSTDTLLFKPIADLRQWGVMESYFVRSFKGRIVVATNKGVFIFDKHKTWLVDKMYGLPDDIILHTAVFLNDTIYLSTTDGVYTINISALSRIKMDYTLTNLTVVYDTMQIPIKLKEQITINTLPHEINVLWEINSHPYPERLHYSYRLGRNQPWTKVNTAGKINIIDPQFGTMPVYLRITDNTNGYEKIVLLLTLHIPKPFYLQAWFYVLLGMMVMGFAYFILSKKRIRNLKQKADKAEMEAHELQLRLDTLQFLLKPHFIFNALSSVQNLILKNEIDKSLEYTGYFAKFLRGIMQNSDNKLISLKEEVDNTQRYIELEKLRFNDNVQVELAIDEHLNINEILIVPFLFQPFVENIFKHAFTKETKNPRIQFSTKQSENKVVFTISDNGVGLNERTYSELISKSTSKGLKITLAQLQKYFPNKHSLSVSENPTGGTSWEISILY